MITRRQSVENFKSKMDDLINSKYILADNKVSDVLKTVSDSSMLFELFEHVTDNFDYETTKTVCFMKIDGEGKFFMPKKDEDILAFCFLLLLEIDAKKVDLLSLCSEYFVSPDGKQGAYDLFATEVLTVFKSITVKVAEFLISSDEDVLEEKGEEQLETYQEETPPSKAETEIFILKGKVLEAKEKYPKEVEVYDELIFILDELSYFVKIANAEGITLALIGLKYIKPSVKRVKIDIDTIIKYISEVIR